MMTAAYGAIHSNRKNIICTQLKNDITFIFNIWNKRKRKTSKKLVDHYLDKETKTSAAVGNEKNEFVSGRSASRLHW
jgi:hypothetical protein